MACPGPVGILRLGAILALILIAPLRLDAQDDAGGTDGPRPVKLMELTERSHPLAREFFGRVKARETVDLAFQVGGQIVDLPVVEGRSLRAGATVARLDLAPFRRELERAEVNLAKADRDLTRLRGLSNSTVSDVQIRDAQTQSDLARIAVEEAGQRLEDATLETAFDALVARREVARYATVAAGEPVVRLHDMSELRVDIEVPEVLFRRAADGGGATFSAAFPGDSETFPLALREFEAETAEVAQTYAITLAFTGDVPDWVLPGASVSVTATAPRGTGDDVILPETALVFDPDRNPGVMVYRDGEDGGAGRVEWRPVEIAIRDDTRIALTGGLAPGSRIVSAGASQLEDGQAVRPFAGFGD